VFFCGFGWQIGQLWLQWSRVQIPSLTLLRPMNPNKYQRAHHQMVIEGLLVAPLTSLPSLDVRIEDCEPETIPGTALSTLILNERR
jgi:hypothetical protein